MRCEVVLSSVVLVPCSETSPRRGAEADASGASDAINADISADSTTSPADSSGGRDDFDFVLGGSKAEGCASLSQPLFGGQEAQYTADGHRLLAGSAP